MTDTFSSVGAVDSESSVSGAFSCAATTPMKAAAATKASCLIMIDSLDDGEQKNLPDCRRARREESRARGSISALARGFQQQKRTAKIFMNPVTFSASNVPAGDVFPGSMRIAIFVATIWGSWGVGIRRLCPRTKQERRTDRRTG